MPKPRMSSKEPAVLTTISFYDEDINQLDELVRALKDRGAKFASKSSVVRLAMRHLARLPIAEIAEQLLMTPVRGPRAT